MLCEGCTLFSARDSECYSRLHGASLSEISDGCLISRVAWNAGFNYQKLYVADTLSLISDGGVFTSPHMTCPIGALDETKLAAVIHAARPSFEQRGWPLRVLYIDEVYLPLFRSLPGYQAQITYNPDFSDYVYDADTLRQLTGKTLHGQRNQFNRFLRAHPDYEYRPISADDRDEALALVRTWCEERGLDCCNLCQSDYLAIEQAFIDFADLDIHGGSIRLGGRLIAFAMGTLLRQNMAVIHFEKAATGFEGLYAAINKLVLDYAFPDVLLVNREEDMGMAGLRKAKTSYGPVRMIHKYEALLSPCE
jgi:uncharacterized protein